MKHETWRDSILALFGEPTPTLSFFADPHGLMSDGVLQRMLSDRNIDVLEFRDSVSFMYLYESRYREVLSLKGRCLAVMIKSEGFDTVPYELLCQGQTFSVGLDKIFPRLSLPVLKTLDREDFDSLYNVYRSYEGNGSDSSTIEFILSRVYGLSFEIINDKTSLIRLLLLKHYKRKHFPSIINQYLINKLSGITAIEELPINRLVGDPEFFYEFLTKEWEAFIGELIKICKEENWNENMSIPEYPFGDFHVRRLVDNLFTEGKLKPVKVHKWATLPQWVSFGITKGDHEDGLEGIRNKISMLSEMINENMSHGQWVEAAFLNAEIKENITGVKNIETNELIESYNSLQAKLDKLFESWILNNYCGLSNMPYLPRPVMVHQVPRYLSHKRKDKLCLIVLDAMSLVQWKQIEVFLENSFVFDKHGVFAWIPTITSISRQSIFAGEIPIFFSSSINTTSKEASHWRLFWENQGIVKSYVDYCRLSSGDMGEINQYLKPTNKVLGVIIDIIDELVHSAIQGYEGLHAEIEIWLKSGYLEGLLWELLDRGYEIYIVSDHGNRECIGIGRILEGVLAHTRGERLRVYNSRVLRDDAAARYSSIPFNSTGLPKDMFPLLARRGEAFVSKGSKVVSHGGMSLEEVIVPFIRVQRRKENINND